MAVEFNAVGSATGNTASLSFNHSPAGEGRVLLVGVVFCDPLEEPQFVEDVFFGGARLEQSVHVGAAGAAGVDLWRMIAPPAGSAQVLVNLSGACLVAVVAASYAGAHPTAPWGVAAGASGSGLETSVNTAATAEEGRVVDFVGIYGQDVAVDGSPHGSQEKRHNVASGGTFARVSALAGDDEAGGVASLAWTLTASRAWRHIAQEVLAAPAGRVSARAGGWMIRRPGRLRFGG